MPPTQLERARQRDRERERRETGRYRLWGSTVRSRALKLSLCPSLSDVCVMEDSAFVDVDGGESGCTLEGYTGDAAFQATECVCVCAWESASASASAGASASPSESDSDSDSDRKRDRERERERER